MLRAMKALPRAEVDYVQEFLHQQGASLARSERDIRFMLARNRLKNRICDLCLKKGSDVKLLLCSKCRLTWFCSVGCQSLAFPRHKQWCGVPSAKRDLGPMGTQFVSLPPRK